MSKPEQLPGQMVLGTTQHLVQEGLPEDMRPERRISLPNLLVVIGNSMDFGKDASYKEYIKSEPDQLESGLYLQITNPRYQSAHHVIRVGVESRNNKGKETKDLGIVFPPEEYKTVARNARDLARATVSRTARASRRREPTLTEAEATAKRSAGHALIEKMGALTRLETEYDSDIAFFLDIYHDLTGTGARYKARNIDMRRAKADEKVHETIDIASVTLEAEDVAVAGMHKAAKRRLYGQHLSIGATTANWLRYLGMLNRHAKAKREKLQISNEMCQTELVKYQPFLDAKRQSELQPA